MKAFWLTVAESTIGVLLTFFTLGIFSFSDRSMEFSEIKNKVKNENIKSQIDEALLPLQKHNKETEMFCLMALAVFPSAAFSIRNGIFENSWGSVLFPLSAGMSIAASYGICYAIGRAMSNAAQNKMDRTLTTLKTMAKEGISDQTVYDTLALDVAEDYARREIINRRIRIVAYIVFVALGVLFAFAFKG